MKKKYSKLINGRVESFEKIIKDKYNFQESLNDQQVARCLFSEERKRDTQIKRSSSVLGVSPSKYLDNEELSVNKRISKDDNTLDEDIMNLDKLSMMNMGARYELLSVNQMMLDLDLKLVS